jgi:probable F420-dependent oxidoreductase
LIVERDPITTAKEVASVDLLSNGRVLFGIGGGWNAEEMENHGTPFKRRWRVLRERILAMKAIWTKDEAEYHGELIDFDPIWAYPKPVQKPHPPIIMGGDGARTFDRVVEFCDGWMPIYGRASGSTSGTLEEKIQLLKQRLSDAGRDPASVSISLFAAPTEEEMVEKLESYGVDRVIFGLPPAGPDVVLPLLDRYAKLMR